MTTEAAVQTRPQPAELPAQLPPERRPAAVDSSALLQGGRCVEIRHNGEIYRLQSTRLGKLILTK